MGKKILYVLIIVVLIVAGIYAAKHMSEENKTTQTGTNTLDNKINSNEKNETEENITEEPQANKIENNVVEDETTTSLSPEEQAKQIVKDNWGEDDSVYFYHEDIIDGKHVVSVRECSTTKALYWYYVDLETGSFDIE